MKKCKRNQQNAQNPRFELSVVFERVGIDRKWCYISIIRALRWIDRSNGSRNVRLDLLVDSASLLAIKYIKVFGNAMAFYRLS